MSIKIKCKDGFDEDKPDYLFFDHSKDFRIKVPNYQPTHGNKISLSNQFQLLAVAQKDGVLFIETSKIHNSFGSGVKMESLLTKNENLYYFIPLKNPTYITFFRQGEMIFISNNEILMIFQVERLEKPIFTYKIPSEVILFDHQPTRFIVQISSTFCYVFNSNTFDVIHQFNSGIYEYVSMCPANFRVALVKGGNIITTGNDPKDLRRERVFEIENCVKIENLKWITENLMILDCTFKLNPGGEMDQEVVTKVLTSAMFCVLNLKKKEIIKFYDALYQDGLTDQTKRKRKFFSFYLNNWGIVYLASSNTSDEFGKILDETSDSIISQLDYQIEIPCSEEDGGEFDDGIYCDGLVCDFGYKKEIENVFKDTQFSADPHKACPLFYCLLSDQTIMCFSMINKFSKEDYPSIYRVKKLKNMEIVKKEVKKEDVEIKEVKKEENEIPEKKKNENGVEKKKQDNWVNANCGTPPWLDNTINYKNDKTNPWNDLQDFLNSENGMYKKKENSKDEPTMKSDKSNTQLLDINGKPYSIDDNLKRFRVGEDLSNCGTTSNVWENFNMDEKKSEKLEFKDSGKKDEKKDKEKSEKKDEQGKIEDGRKIKNFLKKFVYDFEVNDESQDSLKSQKSSETYESQNYLSPRQYVDKIMKTQKSNDNGEVELIPNDPIQDVSDTNQPTQSCSGDNYGNDQNRDDDKDSFGDTSLVRSFWDQDFNVNQNDGFDNVNSNNNNTSNNQMYNDYQNIRDNMGFSQTSNTLVNLKHNFDKLKEEMENKTKELNEKEKELNQFKKKFQSLKNEIEQRKEKEKLILKNRTIFGAIEDCQFPLEELSPKRILGKGQFGVVVEVFIKKSKKKFCLKSIYNFHPFHQQPLLDIERVKFIPVHKNIVPVYFTFKTVFTNEFESFFRKENCFFNYSSLYKTGFIATPIYQENFSKFCEKRKLERKVQPFFDSKEIINFVEQLLEGICFLNECEISHRDLKGENIFIDGSNLVIGDFGSHLNFIKVEMENLTLKGQVDGFCKGGTPFYLPNEIVKTKLGKNSILNYSKCDLFAVGLIVYLALSKIRKIEKIDHFGPYSGWNNASYYEMREQKNYVDLSEKYDSRIRDLIKKMLKIKFNERITCFKALEELRKIKKHF